MARGIYEVKLKERYYPALSAADAVEMQLVHNGVAEENDVEVSLVVKEEHTMQLFLLARTMYELEKFERDEIEVAVCALARKMGYFADTAEVVSCILNWVETTLEELTMHELEEWIIG